jgi:hypothetical protein
MKFYTLHLPSSILYGGASLSSFFFFYKRIVKKRKGTWNLLGKHNIKMKGKRMVGVEIKIKSNILEFSHKTNNTRFVPRCPG